MSPRSAPRAADAYEAVLSEGARPAHAVAVQAMRAQFEARTGAFGPDDPWFEARSRAFWDDAVTTQGFAAAVAAGLEAVLLPWARAFGHAHRGLFRARRDGGVVHLDDVWGGASFCVTEVEPGLADALAVANQLFDGRVAACAHPFSVALLPGALFHPPEATPSIEAVLAAARRGGLRTGAVLDALLRMERHFAGLSRMKASFAYRAEALSPRPTG